MNFPYEFENIAALKAGLGHVLWIGGPTDSGKTTTAARLGEKYGLPVYHGDQHWRENWAKITPDQQPAMFRWDQMSMDERWVTRTVEDLTEHTLQIMRERLPFIFEDLMGMDSNQPVVAEWFGFLPMCIEPLLSSKNQAVWLIGADSFRMESIAKRGKSGFHLDTSDPEKAWENHYQRDVRIVEIMQEQAENLGLRAISNDGELSVEEIVGQVEAHFGNLLA